VNAVVGFPDDHFPHFCRASRGFPADRAASVPMDRVDRAPWAFAAIANTRIGDTASAFYATAVNVGIGGPALIGAVLAGLGLVLVTLTDSSQRSARRPIRV
jgi:hypothetical protein